ncbi:MAG: hypothetical protein ABMA02_08795 [Saprospiraceae bacterium]
MQFLFGFLILALLAAALLLRRRQKKVWLHEERHEESGTWIDKRSGERGTYGSLDAERDAERHAITRQGRINDLTLDIRNYAFEHFPGFHARSDAGIRDFTAFVRSEIGRVFAAAEAMLTGDIPEASPVANNDDPHAHALKKRLLDFVYEQCPKLLDLDLDAIRQFDRFVGIVSATLAGKMQSQ